MRFASFALTLVPIVLDVAQEPDREFAVAQLQFDAETWKRSRRFI